jgi:DNA-binding protein H-NS
MAKLSALDEIQKLQDQIAKKREEAAEEVRQELQAARNTVRELETQLAELLGKKPRKTAERAAKRCSICVGQGKSGEGHTKRTHAKWLKDQKAS